MDYEFIRLENIVKFYGNVQALANVTLSIREGEVLGLVGDNGAGKSTLAKIIAGDIRADSGDIFYKGKKVNIKNTRDSIDLGIETIYQDSALVNQLSVSRNLFLGREPVKRGSGFIKVVDKQYMNNKSRELLRQAGIKKNIDPNVLVSKLSGGERQSIAIARAMFFKAELIILDEPTNNLGVEESKHVLNFIQELKSKGQTSIFITHNIHHIIRAADRIAVLRHGELVGNVLKKDTSLEEVEEIITGSLNKKISVTA
jgi:simple sugar transport system ATP-binding protein